MESMDLATLWAGMLEQLKKVLPKPIYETWFVSSLIPTSYENDVLVLAAAQKFVCNFVNKNYADQLNEAAEAVTGRPTTVKLEDMNAPAAEPAKPAKTDDLYKDTLFSDEDLPKTPPKKKAEPEPKTVMVKEANESISPPPEEPTTEDNLIPNYTFDNFIVGNSNRIAYSIAASVAEAPAKKYNPLYIYGGSGLGKTHLMHAIGHQILKNFPHMRLRCITSEDFVNDFIQAIQDKNTENFRQQYRNIDVLLVDDIQFLGQGDKDSSKEEFFHTFNKLYQGQKQMVFTSDRPPLDIKSLEDRLRSRFQSGTVTGIEPPDLETRTAILRTWAQKEKINIDKDAINYIAANVSDNIRDLYGAYNNVLSMASIEKNDVTLSLTQRALKYLVAEKEEKKYITIDEITSSVCRFYSVNYNELMGKKRTKNIALARQVAMYLCRELTGNTYPHIGTAFSGRDHTTVMHACEKITKMMNDSDTFKEMIERLKEKILDVDK